MTTLISQFFINHHIQTISSRRASALSSKNKDITPKQALNLITDGIGIIGIMFLTEYIFQQLKIRQYSGMMLLPIILIWLTIKHYEDERQSKKDANDSSND